MSTLPNQANIPPTWKQEVNQRVAAHKIRKGSSAAEADGEQETPHSASRRAAAAAARVAARYANAPSYSEILGGDARAAVRAAEAASRAALEAQAAAESVLAELEAASAAEPVWELHTSEAATPEWQTTAVAEQREAAQGYEIRWEPDMPVRQAEPATGHALRGSELLEDEMEDVRGRSRAAQIAPDGDLMEMVEAAQPIHANLIEFPRELVAPRKARPRRAEGRFAASAAQLSIFEVDPGTISIDPTATETVDEAEGQGTAGQGMAGSGWAEPEWSGIRLDAHPQVEYGNEAAHEPLEEPLPATLGPALELAPMNLRLMAAVVNGSLIVGAFLGAAIVVAANLKNLPPLREVEIVSALALVLVGVAYAALSYTLVKGTPGMHYAGISLCTFDGRKPTRAQRCARLVALLVSVLPVGLGVLWAIFDEDHLSWHDRLSQTYLRRF